MNVFQNKLCFRKKIKLIYKGCFLSYSSYIYLMRASKLISVCVSRQKNAFFAVFYSYAHLLKIQLFITLRHFAHS